VIFAVMDGPYRRPWQRLLRRELLAITAAGILNKLLPSLKSRMAGHLIALVDPCRLLGRPSAALWLIKTAFNLQRKNFSMENIYCWPFRMHSLKLTSLIINLVCFEKKKILIIVIR
jgi:hypothetical protein